MDLGQKKEPDLSICAFTEKGIYQCPNGKHYFVRNIYPPVQEVQPRMMLVINIYFLCFIVGICGNASILTIIRGILSERKASRHYSIRRTDNAILYIAALCVVDFLMSLSLPPTIMNSIIGFWMFGTGICKLHHICGSVGRIVSTFLITAMSFDRFVAVCYPYNNKYRSRKFVIYTICALWILAFLLLLPILTYAGAEEMLVHHLVQKDASHAQHIVENLFTFSTFALGYVIPLLLIIFFNSRLIGKLYTHTKQLRTTIPLRWISIYTILIAVFYFVCKILYAGHLIGKIFIGIMFDLNMRRLSVLYATYMSLFEERSEPTSEMLLFIIFCIITFLYLFDHFHFLCVHLLPYIGSASNWVLYGLLNTQLQLRQNDTVVGHQADTERFTLNALSTTAISPVQTIENGSGSNRNMDGRFHSIPCIGGSMNRKEVLANPASSTNCGLTTKYPFITCNNNFLPLQNRPPHTENHQNDSENNLTHRYSSFCEESDRSDDDHL